MMNRAKKVLYRKVNTKARGVRHSFGGDFKNSRYNTRDSIEQVKGSMHGKMKRGLDYTPLFRFLISKVGSKWDRIFSEAKSRLDKTDPIFWLVAIDEEEKEDYVRVGESTYFSGLFIDDLKILRLTNPKLKPKDFTPFCNCCTHTFNGKIFGSE